MEFAQEISAFATHWPVWLVTVTLVVAAVIDGVQLRVPNWLTFPLVLSGWVYSACWLGAAGLGWSLLGTVIGLALLLPAYAVGGMGAGDVKLLAGVGAWMHVMLKAAGTPVGPAEAMFYAFAVSTVVGAVMAVAMAAWRRGLSRHCRQFWMILGEFLTIRDPNQLAAIAAERKSSMLLLPYGIPLAIGTIAYFLWMGMLV